MQSWNKICTHFCCQNLINNQNLIEVNPKTKALSKLKSTMSVNKESGKKYRNNIVVEAINGIANAKKQLPDFYIICLKLYFRMTECDKC